MSGSWSQTALSTHTAQDHVSAPGVAGGEVLSAGHDLVVPLVGVQRRVRIDTPDVLSRTGGLRDGLRRRAVLSYHRMLRTRQRAAAQAGQSLIADKKRTSAEAGNPRGCRKSRRS